MTEDQLLNRSPVNKTDLAFRQCLNIVISDIEQGPFEIDEVPGNMDADDLPRAFERHLVPISEARDDERAAVGPLAFANEIGPADKV